LQGIYGCSAGVLYVLFGGKLIMPELNTFIRLIKKYNVEIPMIQRDYAQGRTDAEIEQIRKRFVADLYDMIKDKKPKDLDYVYGPVSNKTFVPLDGQQRLTTLFLLHWYLALRSGNKLLDLRKFTYKVRITTQEFVDALLDAARGLSLFADNSNIKSISKRITDASWYYSIWNYDPTVQGMLVMLDAIETKFSETEDNDWYGLWDNLVDQANPPITFSVLEMQQYNLSDELYMRMNARGLALTSLENFKAWINKWIDEDDSHVKDWSEQFDKAWSNMFWRLSSTDENKPEQSFDSTFMRFFNGIALLFYAEADHSGQEEKDIVKNIRSLAQDRVLMRTFEELDCFNKDNIRTVYKILELMNGWHEDAGNTQNVSFKQNDDKSKKLNCLPFRNFIDSKVGYKDRVIFYAMFKFLFKFGENKQFLPDWLRVIRNLIEYTGIGADSLSKALEGIRCILAGIQGNGNILEYLALNPKLEIGFFNQDQLNEECLKARLITIGEEEWKEKIEALECHGLLKGRLACFLQKIDKEKQIVDLSPGDLEIFKKNSQSAEELWDDKGLREKHNKAYRPIRAILALSGPVNLSWQKNIFLTEWKALFSDSKIKYGLINFLNEIDDDDILNSCEKIIQENKTIIDENDWRKVIVDNENLLNNSDTQKVQNYYNSGIFLFEKNNACGGDILLTKEGRLRDNLIPEYVNDWQIEEWREIKEADKYYYKGHDIVLTKGHTPFRLKFTPNRVILVEVQDNNDWTELSYIEYQGKTQDDMLKEINNLINKYPQLQADYP
jgi:hypothetical protein